MQSIFHSRNDFPPILPDTFSLQQEHGAAWDADMVGESRLEEAPLSLLFCDYS